MRIRRIALACVILALSFSAARPAAAQQMPNMSDPDMQEMMQIGMQMMQRMQESGIDMQALGEQVQSGAMDQEQIMQLLIDKGVIDQDMLKRMESTGRRLITKILKQQMDLSDDEWRVIGPKLERLFAAAQTLGRAGGFPTLPGLNRMPTPLSRATAALKAELAEATGNEARVVVKLREWRDALAKARSELQAARDDLRGVLTVRQEAVLMTMGLLD